MENKLLADYEQQFGVTSAEITSKISRLGHIASNDRNDYIKEIERNLDEVHDLLEQMDLSVKESDVSVRAKLHNRVASYRAELHRLAKEFARAKCTVNIDLEDDNNFAESEDVTSEQKQRLLYTSERLNQSGIQLDNTYRIAVETEEIGSQILTDLNRQRETMHNSFNRLRDANADLGRSTRMINAIIVRSRQHKIILFGVMAAFCFLLIFAFYRSFL
ncbi:vesicle transport through interaction with t-SNAREs homolog 1A [Acyrthosiphon pisum]|uniref:Vesicle transport v-SNARE N-terminal domain-containing protein n=1 Tax=Acyrthosiphon pisum TaxID=7029 RepID=A0A8R2A1E9_ACYPI|nr:vesicle transport through interaction with t-SNAREs homolog 1A [Acyrthosiphon pisum]|eukprot:XP_001944385.1 PREDICTED: vesicle transport through interaction with t-SNAREs homolog 1A [Acyrthosiphon pisum]